MLIITWLAPPRPWKTDRFYVRLLRDPLPPLPKKSYVDPFNNSHLSALAAIECGSSHAGTAPAAVDALALVGNVPMAVIARRRRRNRHCR